MDGQVPRPAKLLSYSAGPGLASENCNRLKGSYLSYPFAKACPTAEDEARVEAALSGMLGIETMLENMAPHAELPAREVLGLVRAVNGTVRDVLLWEAPLPVSDC